MIFDIREKSLWGFSKRNEKAKSERGKRMKISEIEIRFTLNRCLSELKR